MSQTLNQIYLLIFDFPGRYAHVILSIKQFRLLVDSTKAFVMI